MNKIKLILMLLLVIATCNLRAQQQPLPLTIDSAIRLSIQQSKQLKISQSKIESARAKYLQAKALALPSAKISASYTRLSNNIDPFTLQLPATGVIKTLNPQIVNHYTPMANISQVLYAGGQIKYAERSMQLLEAASRFDLEKNKSDIIYNTISAWFNLFKIQHTRKIVEENINQVRGHLYDIRNYEKNGLALKNDVLKIELQLSSLEHTLIEINSVLEIAGYNMSIMLGLPASTIYQLVPTAPMHAGFDNMEAFQDEALANRADLKAMNKRIGMAVLGVKSAYGNYYPVISMGGNYYYNRPNQRAFPQEDQFKATWDAGVTLSWNIHSLYTNRHRIAENKAALWQVQVEKEQLSDAVKTEVNTDYLTYLKNKEKIRVSAISVTQAEENYRIISNRFRNNTVLITDLTDASTLLLQAKINLLVDKADTELSYYKILQSTGSIK